MARKVVPLLALIALGLLLSDVSATGSSADEDIDIDDFSTEAEFSEVPSKDEAYAAKVKKVDAEVRQLNKNLDAKKDATVHQAKASSRHSRPAHGHKDTQKAQKPVTKAAAHPSEESSKKANKHSKQSLVEAPVDAEDDEEPIERIEQFEDEGDFKDQQEAQAAFDEMDAEDPVGRIGLGHPDAAVQEQVQKQKKAKEASKHVQSTLDRIRKLGVHVGRVAAPVAAPVVQESQILASAAPATAPAKPVQEESAAGLVVPAAKPAATSKFLKDRVWMLGASESLGALGKEKSEKKAPSPQAEIIQEAETDDGNDAPHPDSIVNPAFHSLPGKYRRDWSVYSAQKDPQAAAKATLELDEIGDINPKTGRFEAP